MTAISILAGSLGVTVGLAGSASGAQACRYQGNPSFDGLWSQGGGSINHVEGVQADIRTEHAAVCTGDAGHWNTSSAWVMIAEDQNHANAAGRASAGLAQVGFIQNPSYHGDPVFFFEDGATSAGTDYTLWHPWTTRTPGTTNTYAVLWSASCYCLQESINGTVVHQDTWGDPYTYWGTPSNTNLWATVFMGEAHDFGTDMPGNNSGAATVFSNLKTQNSVTDQVANTACAQHGQNDDSARWGLNASNYGCSPYSIFTY